MAKRAAGAVKEATKWVWDRTGSLIYGQIDYKPSEMIMGFDMDDTLIKVASGAKFAKNAKDWKWFSENVVSVIQDYAKQGYQIVIFTNQNGIEKGHTKESDIKQKIEDLQEKFEVPLAVFIASADDEYRKPRVAMWNFFNEKINQSKADVAKSYYVGDAAGRVNGKIKDFSDSDLKFALNLGVIFRTPEQLFLKKELGEDYTKNIGFRPQLITRDGPLFEGSAEKNFVAPKKPEMIIMTGCVGSGKSTFTVTHLKDYVRVNRDTLKTKEKCLKVAEEAILKGKHVVIDNTNPTSDDREPFLKLAKKHNYPVRAFYAKVEKDLAFHNDYQREVNKHRDHLSKKVGSIPIHTYFKNFQMPTTEEGFDEVKVINFIAGPFHNKEDELTYFSFVKGK